MPRPPASPITSRFGELDYRLLTGQFDRVVWLASCTLGTPTSNSLKIREPLTPDSQPLHRLHRPDVAAGYHRPLHPERHLPWRAHVPALSQSSLLMERCGLWCDDMEVLRLHHHYTVKHWRERSAKDRARAAAIYDERASVGCGTSISPPSNSIPASLSLWRFKCCCRPNATLVPITRDFTIHFERAAWARTQTPG